MQTVIRVEKLSKTFNHNKALHAVDLTVRQGDMVALLGPSGSGKSTLLRHLSGLITGDKTPESHVELLGNTVQRAGRLASDIRKSRAQTGYIFQQFNLVNRLTALENVMFGPLRVRGANKAAAEALAKDLLAKVGLAERAHHYPSELSGGQQQRVAIARALAVKPKLMLFDEPTSALDPELRHEVLKVMQDLAEEGMTMVIVTHEIGFAEKVASRLIFIDKGRIAEDGNPQELIANPPSPRLQEFLQHVS